MEDKKMYNVFASDKVAMERGIPFGIFSDLVDSSITVNKEYLEKHGFVGVIFVLPNDEAEEAEVKEAMEAEAEVVEVEAE